MIEVVFMAESCLVAPGYAVDDYRDTLKHGLNIPLGAEARVNGHTVPGDCTPWDGSTLEFVVGHGEKGMAWCTTTELATAHKLSAKRTKEELRKCEEADPSCCLRTIPYSPNQPQKLYDEKKVENALRAARQDRRYQPPPCPLCKRQLRVVRTTAKVRYLRCEEGHFTEREDRTR